ALPDRVTARIADAELLHVARRRQIALLELPEHRTQEAGLLVGPESELHGLVAVTCVGAHFGHGARTRLDHGDGHDVALVVVDLGHADLPADESDHVLISMSTPAGMSSFSSASMVCAVLRVMSISRLWIRISNCSRDFLSTCGLRSTVYLFFTVGRGIGPATRAPVRLAVST